MAIEQSSTVVRSDSSMMGALDEGVVVVSLASNPYLALDDIGRRIWELLEAPTRIDALCARLTNEFDGAPEQVQADVLAFLNELESAGLLHVSVE